MIFVGAISYPLYLWHWPILTFVHSAMGEPPSAGIRVAAVILAILLAWLTYVVIEKPIRFGVRKGGVTAGLVAIMTLLGIGGYVIYSNDGFGFRYEKNIREVVNYKFDSKREYRAGTCFLDAEKEGPGNYRKCDAMHANGRKTLLVWGDSHSAHIFPGYRNVHAPRYHVVQRSATSCAPILHRQAQRHCRDINDHIFREIQAAPPDRIVLAADWLAAPWRQVAVTIEALHKLGIEQIDIVGPVPRWDGTLPRQIYQYYRNDQTHAIPVRMKQGLVGTIFQVDRDMSDFARGQQVRYLSPLSILCNQEGCMTMTGQSAETLTSWDYGHLTTVGATYLVSRFPGFELAPSP